MTWHDMTVDELRGALCEFVPPGELPVSAAELVAYADQLELLARHEALLKVEAQQAAAAATIRRAMPAVPDHVNDVVEAWHNAEREPEPEMQFPELSQWQMMEMMATRLARSSLIGPQFRNKPDDVLMVLLVGHDLGLKPSQAFSEIVVINGKPTKSAFLLRLLVRRAGHKIWVEVARNDAGYCDRATAYGIRKDEPDITRDVSFSIADAVAAELCALNPDGRVKGNGVWAKYTEDMLVARATSRLCRRMFEDAIGGAAYVPEELGFVEGEGEEVAPSGTAAQAVPLDELTRKALRDRLDALTDELRDDVRNVWRRQNFPTLDELLTTHYGAIDAIITAREKRMPEDAELVTVTEDIAVVGDVCDECGNAVDAHADDCAARPM